MTKHLRTLRQVALITRDLDESLRFWTDLLDLEECYRDDLSAFGLSNVLMPIGDGFLELLQVEQPSSAGARFLERHGEGLYMTIFEGTDPVGLLRDLEENQLPIAWQHDSPHYVSVHLHPKAMGRVLYSVEHPKQPGEWPPAGFDWRRHVRTDVVRGIAGAGMITANADEDAGRWHRLFGEAPARYWVQDGLRIANVPIGAGDTFIEFQQPVEPDAPATRYLDRHGPGMYYWALDTTNLEAALDRARALNVTVIREDRNAGGGRSAWLHPRNTHGVLTELIERR
jgi:catechol 2,3-dioxygenase-like lactoylglutathione lyase family enzyme